MDKRNTIKFYRKMKWSGESLCLTIPKEICQELGLKNKTEVTITYGKDEISQYITIWKNDTKRT